MTPPGYVARNKIMFDLLGDYVWHCHILSHEEHDMMRPFRVTNAAANAGSGFCWRRCCSQRTGSNRGCPDDWCSC